MPDELTVEDLAREAAVPVSTVRLYQTRGLLPPPERKGRVGYYGPGHVARMRLIGRLQEDGFSLASIKHLVDAWEEGRGLTDLMGLEAQVADWERQPVRLRPEELTAVLDGVELTPEVLARSQALGLVTLTDDGGVEVTDIELLRVGSELMRMGIPADEVLDEYGRLQRSVRPITKRFVDLFDRHFLDPVKERGFEPDDVRELTDVVNQLRQLATRVVAAAMRQAFADAAADKLAELAPVVGEAKPAPSTRGAAR